MIEKPASGRGGFLIHAETFATLDIPYCISHRYDAIVFVEHEE
jgi:hypothetical protein